MGDIQKTSSKFLDCWRDWPISRPLRLGLNEGQRITFHLTRSRFFRCLRWNRALEFGWTIYVGSPSTRGTLFLWFSNCYGKYSFLDLFSVDRYIYQGLEWKKIPLQCCCQYSSNSQRLLGLWNGLITKISLLKDLLHLLPSKVFSSLEAFAQSFGLNKEILCRDSHSRTNLFQEMRACIQILLAYCTAWCKNN